MTFILALSTNMKNTMGTLFRTLKNARVHPVVLAIACLTLLAVALAAGKITNEILNSMDRTIDSAQQGGLLP
jgi:hypothetical protein